MNTLAILTEQKKLISGHQDRHLRLWDLDRSKLVSTTPSDTTVCQRLLTYGQDSAFSALTDCIKLVDISTFVVKDIIMKPQGVVYDMKVKRGHQEKLIVAENNTVNHSVVMSFMPTRLVDIRSPDEDAEVDARY